MSPTTLDLIARTIDWIEGHPSGGRGRPRCPTSDVIRTLEAFAGAGLCWRRLLATAERASGSTLRRRLLHWAAQAVLPRVHRVLLRMVRSGPDAAAQAWNIVVDSCSVRAKHGGDLTGPNPTDRGKPGTKYHLAVSTDGLPVAAVVSAANVPDTVLFPELLRLAQVACASIARVYADAGYDSRENRAACLHEGIQPLIRKAGTEHGSGLGAVRSVVERVLERLLRHKRLDRRHDRSSTIIRSLLTVACIFILAEKADEL